MTEESVGESMPWEAAGEMEMVVVFRGWFESALLPVKRAWLVWGGCANKWRTNCRFKLDNSTCVEWRSINQQIKLIRDTHTWVK